MRIPSQFTEDNLYSRPKRRSETIQTYRRLIRLGLGLLLVVVVMQQAAKPVLYETFFAEETAFAPSPPNDDNRSPSANALDAQATTEKPPPIDPDTLFAARQIAKRIPETDRSAWIMALLNQQRHTGISVLNPPDRTWIETQWDENIPDSESWKELLENAAVGNQPAERSTDDSQPTDDSQQIRSLVTSLDNWVTQRVVDGSVWNPKDSDALYLYLYQAMHPPRTTPAVIGILPLLQQPEVYRGKWVAFSGRVARSEKQPVSENAYDIDSYWRLWLRPRTGADRPVQVIVPRVPDAIAEIGSEATVTEGPAVMIVGRFLKRLAYRSSVGADLAPVIVGRIVPQSGTPTGVNASNKLVPAKPKKPSLLAIVAAAAMAGIGFAGLLFWRTVSQAKKSQRLRDANRKDPSGFLDELQNGNLGDQR
ncbi:hypothetical protein CA13_44640 [Planctomycetes bacterium CA13]|uniref:Transmembrane protein n=1 Tax=Novipirellula herctigrandis TaxID=2527986 RepID=A0A5C5Z838_9BACT|nr:hypothetical protein CA13_44640 [Planctomycetes bacterium CA13]